jgi:beta-glucanase (GH16 family)
VIVLAISAVVLVSLAQLAAEDRTQTAVLEDWGPVVDGDEFDATDLDQDRWYVVEGAGHEGEGRRARSQVRVQDGTLTVTGRADGTTGCIGMNLARQYGRWEARMRVPRGASQYHPVLILWPADDRWPESGEVDYAEARGANSPTIEFNYLSNSSGAPTWTAGAREIDLTQWHNYAVEWTPEAMRGFVDGQLFFEDRDVSRLPPGPMRQTIQLDWFPDRATTTESSMQVDWVRVYDGPSR